MLWLRRLQIEGFGPFAERQVIEFPESPGVTVIYGENMRGKTSLLAAIRYAFFGRVMARGLRQRRLLTVCNRENAAQGRYEFSVVLTFNFDDETYELSRSCRSSVAVPESDADFVQEVMLRRDRTILGPDERARALQHAFPGEIARFFLFDGELLQEYEELLVNESDTGHHISEAIDRILGVPILTQARVHLTTLTAEADQQAAREAQRHQATESLGTALGQAVQQRDAHKLELARLRTQLGELTAQRTEQEEFLAAHQKYSSAVEALDDARTKHEEIIAEEKDKRAELQVAMSDAWRSLLRDRVRAAKLAAQTDAEHEFESYGLRLRAQAIESAHCETCDQDVPPEVQARLRDRLDGSRSATTSPGSGLRRLVDLGRFDESDNTDVVKLLSRRLAEIGLEKVRLSDQISDLTTQLADSDPEFLRRSRATYSETVDKIAAVKRAIDDETTKIYDQEVNIQRLTQKLESIGSTALLSTQARARLLRAAAEVFGSAVDKYKSDLRLRVEASASRLFLRMTTERLDYAGLSINEGYGLTIKHQDGAAEEARSAGAEHVVALALMGALQENAPLRGPIVMDSPFGRLDDAHTSNVVATIPEMAVQVALLVYEAEVGKPRMRELLGPHLLREYELVRESARRTTIMRLGSSHD
jgi:DNA sulfur modification protein DndD